jgi:hypothetical protein
LAISSAEPIASSSWTNRFLRIADWSAGRTARGEGVAGVVAPRIARSVAADCQKKIPERSARLAVSEALNIATNYSLAPSRRAENIDRLRGATGRLDLLIQATERFAQLVSGLSPQSKRKLNEVMSQDLRNFDSEVFTNIIRVVMDKLPGMSPAVTAEKARLVLSDAGSGAPKDPALAQIPREVPKILDLWETIPAQARTQVEAEVRSRSACKSVVQFFWSLASALQSSYPQLTRGWRPATEQSFARNVAAIWCRLGLRPGLAYFGGDKDKPGCHRPSSFQRFCDLAFTAVGQKSRISKRQVANLKRKTIAPKR